ncbi:PaaX family transcriptional regulator C-terminal domain-containing protein [Aestuariicoccus sp. MJ-SS9]|uniref:PaaX family transcriptional regulator C-terminal domain-containing protein n=1 Tax=Aestuariicoccus sp. MJ-SS9 TaxID=3079855 RepID=UPI002907B1E6|nr:PaaX family transcriptional regulator C-terminal domain-containing protein [Aestuariicoccus sp. MJ-SS9]MDU8910618.1 PaaX family transcriptional regulator C-terminal domain-containing protein [Aestuariicoccus sp. MJ-SS9]
MTATAFERSVSALTEGQTLRVWSVIVTIFGDLAQAPGQTLSGRALARLCAPMGLRDEAQRVALHRLRKEGWIESRRDGRQSHYGLTDWGRAQARAASPRIYGPAPAGPLYLWVTETAAEPRADVVAIAPNLALSTAIDGPPGSMVQQVAPEALPGWMRARVADPALVAEAARLTAALERLRTELPKITDPAQQAVLRVLMVHGWRRIALKLPLLPDAAFPDGWQGAAARAHLGALLQALPRPAPAALEPA